MFLKYNYSKGHCYLFLVESYRNEQGKVQHKNLIYLGRVNNRKDQSIQKIKGSWVKIEQADVILKEFEDPHGLAKWKPMFAKS
jgi:hypothetical protein